MDCGRAFTQTRKESPPDCSNYRNFAHTSLPFQQDIIY